MREVTWQEVPGQDWNPGVLKSALCRWGYSTWAFLNVPQTCMISPSTPHLIHRNGKVLLSPAASRGSLIKTLNSFFLLSYSLQMLSPARASWPLFCDAVQISSYHFISIVHMLVGPRHLKQTSAATSKLVSRAPASPPSNPICAGHLESLSSNKFLVKCHFIWLFFSQSIKSRFPRLSFDCFALMH